MRVAVLAGGRSSEHDVSLESGRSIAGGLSDAGHDVTWVEIARDGRWSADGQAVTIEPAAGLLGADVVFPALHGPFGEDGTVQGLLEMADVPYVGAGVAASAVCIDKVLFKELMSRAGLPQVDFV
ncbi:MAG: D-alanine--D-alanine ligase A, partial [Solirubrobacterales bacterium]